MNDSPVPRSVEDENVASPPWAQQVTRRLAGHGVGGALRYRASASSSNDLARRWLDEGGPDGLVVVVAEQTAGRGRRGRQWLSPPGMGLYFSVGLRPRLAAGHLSWLTFLAAVATAEGLRRVGVAGEIRWPNDIEVEGHKLGGILVETRLEGDAVTSAVIGVGINLLQQAGEFPEHLQGMATSVRLASGRAPDPAEVMVSVLEHLEESYKALIGSPDVTAAGDRLLQRWKRLAPGHRGRAVHVEAEDESFRGVTDGIESDGALRVRRVDGTLVVVRLGELRRLREGGE